VTTTETVKGRPTWHHNGNEGWPGIVSRFQLVILAGRRSKQLLNGAQPRIPVDPLKRRNTSIALEDLRRGLVPFRGQTADEPSSVPRFDNSVVNVADLELSRV
jgi:DNA-directed RNA polymerase omega subunit